MHLDQWLKQLHEEEVLTKEAGALEAQFDQMDPADLLEIATGSSTIEKVAEQQKEAELPRALRHMVGKGGESIIDAVKDLPEHVAKRVREQRGGQSIGKMIAEKGKGGIRGRISASRLKQQAGDPKSALRRWEGSLGQEGGVSSKSNLRVGPFGGTRLKKKAAAKLEFMDKVARQIAREHVEVEKLASGKRIGVGKLGLGLGLGSAFMVPPIAYMAGVSHGYKQGKKGSSANMKKEATLPIPIPSRKGMVKQDEFTSPEAQAKAKVLSRAMKASKGAPPRVRKGAIKMVAKKI